ncbi:hypothetical protein H6G74_15775 [Nostoc spongiaeforme FACHB-130]|uniref:Uncharacterized protein n=1 Tax=Nostoc spongiaeforme FACHB-130 TaxID=1357510 RepID=A0ABR8FWG6_9NOSO|nr:hypothetical protein [Nostoc spongiaeforme]MBD2595777.1 hypothetical protein [Nostoc spongiaeforme FACHB-130]
MAEEKAKTPKNSASIAKKHWRDILGDAKDIASAVAVGALVTSSIGLSGPVAAAAILVATTILKVGLDTLEEEEQVDKDAQEEQQDD